MGLDIYLDACIERFSFDREYRARLQRELFDTDAHRSIQATLNAHRLEQAARQLEQTNNPTPIRRTA